MNRRDFLTAMGALPAARPFPVAALTLSDFLPVRPLTVGGRPTGTAVATDPGWYASSFVLERFGGPVAVDGKRVTPEGDPWTLVLGLAPFDDDGPAAPVTSVPPVVGETVVVVGWFPGIGPVFHRGTVALEVAPPLLGVSPSVFVPTFLVSAPFDIVHTGAAVIRPSTAEVLGIVTMPPFVPDGRMDGYVRVAPLPPASSPVRAAFGIVVRPDDGVLTVEETLPDTPAAEAGIRPGDAIVVGQSSTMEIAREIAGDSHRNGRKIVFTIRSGRHVRTVELVATAMTPRPGLI